MVYIFWGLGVVLIPLIIFLMYHSIRASIRKCTHQKGGVTEEKSVFDVEL